MIPGLWRLRSRSVTVVLLLVSLSSLTHRPQGDEVCVPAGLEWHDESQHVFTTGGKAGHGEHCAVCHWMRTLKPAFAPRAAWLGHDDRRSAMFLTFGQSHPQTARHNLPARAPPSSVY